MNPTQGLHHITAVAGNPQTNVDFYQQVLGQRLVKTTVNFDDPTTYHLYYADLSGTPGTVLTFFPWRDMPLGRAGVGEATVVAYSIPEGSFGYWRERLENLGQSYREEERFGIPRLGLHDPDGMQIELVASANSPAVQPWASGPIPEEHSLRGFAGVALWLREIEATAELITTQLGYSLAGQEGMRLLFRAAGDGPGSYVEFVHIPGAPRGQFGSGSIHHIAFRAADDAEQLEYRQQLLSAGQRVTTVQDRQYFHSIYFREPGGVLFEIATDTPGFTIDESVESLGSNLKLPPWYETHRTEIEAVLPPLDRSLKISPLN